MNESKELGPPLGQKIPREPHDEDGYCTWCGNGWWKPHRSWCAWRIAMDENRCPACRVTPDPECPVCDGSEEIRDDIYIETPPI